MLRFDISTVQAKPRFWTHTLSIPRRQQYVWLNSSTPYRIGSAAFSRTNAYWIKKRAGEQCGPNPGDHPSCSDGLWNNPFEPCRYSAVHSRRRFDGVVVWKFDRFARSASHLLRALETFRSLGIEFVSLSEQVDTSTPTGKMVFTVLGAVAELEHSLIADRVRPGLRNAKAKGKRLRRPRVVVDVARMASLRTACPMATRPTNNLT